MLLGTDLLPAAEVLPWQRPAALLLALGLIAETGYALLFRGAVTGGIPAPIESFGSPRGIGRTLFTEYLLPFEVTSVLLLVAMVGAIVLARKRKGSR